MSRTDTALVATPRYGRAPRPGRPDGDAEDADATGTLIEEESLIEEVSIDGMCGVY